MDGSDLLLLLGGLGLFLFGMSLMERALKELAGRTFKLFLRRHTQNKLKAIASGALVTGILESSSVVAMIMLAFVGAGIVTMENALAVVLGANFGTTLDAWLVATVGFNVNIENFAYPIIGGAGILLSIFGARKKLSQYCFLALGFALLFLGLNLMKNSVSGMVEAFSLREYADYPFILFFLFGLVLTAIIQSSSATMAIALSALHADAVTFENAIVLMLGAEVGARLKIYVTTGGMADKRRVALGNLLFNLVFAVLSYLVIPPVVYLIHHILGISNDLIGLVFFESFMNLVTLLLFFPFLNRFTAFLNKRFIEARQSPSEFIHKVNPDVPEAAGPALEKEARRFLGRVIRLNRSAFHLQHERADRHDPGEIYEQLKKLEGEIQLFYSTLREQELSLPDRAHFAQLADAVRNGMYAAKSIKDVRHNLEELVASIDEFEYSRYRTFRRQEADFWDQAAQFLEREAIDPAVLVAAMQEAKRNHDDFVKSIYHEADGRKISDTQLSTLLNVNRELHSANKALLNALKGILLPAADAERIGDLAFASQVQN